MTKYYLIKEAKYLNLLSILFYFFVIQYAQNFNVSIQNILPYTLFNLTYELISYSQYFPHK